MWRSDEDGCLRHLAWMLQLGGVENPAHGAAALIAEFGSLPAVLAGQGHRIQRVLGDAETAAVGVLSAFAEAMLHVVRFRALERPLIEGHEALDAYLRLDMAYQREERFRVLYLDTRHQLILDDLHSTGTIDRTAVNIREIVFRAMEIGASSLILVHNHPSGDPSPSRADVTLTKAIIEAGRPLNIAVLDHMIVGRDQPYSLRAGGHL